MSKKIEQQFAVPGFADSVCVVKTRKVGRKIECEAVEHVTDGGMLSHKCMLFGGDSSTNMVRMTLHTAGGRATEKQLQLAHALGLEQLQTALAAMVERITNHGIPE